MSYIFQDYDAGLIYISNFDTSKVTNMTRKFNGCEAQIKVTDSRLIGLLKKKSN